MDLMGLLSLFCVLFTLALMPTISSIAVASRTMSSGIIHGALVALGVVVGDLFFTLIAILGLSGITYLLNVYSVYINHQWYLFNISRWVFIEVKNK